MYIYMLRNKINGKCYVGQTSRDINLRLSQHRYDGRRGEKNTYICKAIHKHGWGSFEKFVLEVVSETEALNDAEVFWISKMNTIAPSGYNIKCGGTSASGWRHSEESKQKMSASLTGRTYEASEEQKGRLLAMRVGAVCSEETKAQISQANTGKKRTEDQRLKMSQDRMGYQASDEAREKISTALKGRVFSDEWKEKISNSKRGLVISNETKAKLRDANGGENCANAKLTWEKVREIRRRFEGGETRLSLAKEFCVDRGTIQKIVNMKTWKE